jgi:hypothetical protein
LTGFSMYGSQSHRQTTGPCRKPLRDRKRHRHGSSSGNQTTFTHPLRARSRITVKSRISMKPFEKPRMKAATASFRRFAFRRMWKQQGSGHLQERHTETCAAEHGSISKRSTPQTLSVSPPSSDSMPCGPEGGVFLKPQSRFPWDRKQMGSENPLTSAQVTLR